jgi:hypothetical protein
MMIATTAASWPVAPARLLPHHGRFEQHPDGDEEQNGERIAQGQ